MVSSSPAGASAPAAPAVASLRPRAGDSTTKVKETILKKRDRDLLTKAKRQKQIKLIKRVRHQTFPSSKTLFFFLCHNPASSYWPSIHSHSSNCLFILLVLGLIVSPPLLSDNLLFAAACAFGTAD
eukprot:GHVT01043528.1.p2 GENE.GHVT01043528.1~~GHVT01043528.1.p2  ORF type:complete len:126 (+),score=19.46 GHVT01043528.1:4740-5117(+)